MNPDASGSPSRPAHAARRVGVETSQHFGGGARCNHRVVVEQPETPEAGLIEQMAQVRKNSGAVSTA